jgi:hypothetical protein
MHQESTRNGPRTPAELQRLEKIALDPGVFAQKLDIVRGQTLMIRMAQADFNHASFLDDRVLDPSRRPGWLPNEELADAARLVDKPQALHLILHTGHVGSTLVSRACAEFGAVLSLREPLVLRNLADLHDGIGQIDSLIDLGQWNTLLGTHCMLWRRGFEDTAAVVLKATSSAARIAPDLLRLCDGRAIYLNLQAEPYLATLLAGDSSALDLRGHGPERIRRFARMYDGPIAPLATLTLGELAAMTWLVERLTQLRLKHSFGDRVLCIDFQDFLADVPAGLRAVMRHFDLPADAANIGRVARSAVFTRYSKAPEHAFSANQRAELLAASRIANSAAIHQGLAWLERYARESTEVAAALSFST